jgi:polar amino acid transport system permease protein
MTIPTSPQVLIQIKDRSRPGRALGIAAALLFLAWIVFQLIINPGFDWRTIGSYLFHEDILTGVVTTILLTAVVMLLGLVIGTVLAVMSLSGDVFLLLSAKAYVWFFRGTPVLVQLVFWYNLSTLFPNIEFGIPFNGPKLFSIPATVAISSFTAALLGLGLNEGAHMGEIIRAGLTSVDPGQHEASKALGHRPWQTFFVVILPQAMKSIIPPTGNQLIGMLKYTSLASVVALGELMNSAERIYSRNFQTIPLLIVASLWYLFMISILSAIQFKIERFYSKANYDNAAATD